jgi:lysophospholipase L1-like esterase
VNGPAVAIHERRGPSVCARRGEQRNKRRRDSQLSPASSHPSRASLATRRLRRQGADRNRTGLKGFAGPRVTTPPRRRDGKRSDGDLGVRGQGRPRGGDARESTHPPRPGGPRLAGPAEAKTKPFYVALGDSLSVGVRPNAAGKSVNSRTGYPRQLAKLVGDLRLVELGCGGATTKSFIAGKKPCQPTRKPGYKNTSAGTSQLATAERFLKRNRSKVAFVTIDIGANDVLSCAKGGNIDLPCVNKGIPAIKKYGPKIAKRLRKTGGRKLPMAVTTIYEPVLAAMVQRIERTDNRQCIG